VHHHISIAKCQQLKANFAASLQQKLIKIQRMEVREKFSRPTDEYANK
jgi:hypothetical protein